MSKQYSNDELYFLMFKLIPDCGSMKGTYFVQTNGNEEDIRKFEIINKNNGIKFYERFYTWSELCMLMDMKGLWEDDGSADNVEFMIFKGEFRVPGKKKPLEEHDLDAWYEKYVGDHKFPSWERIVEEVIDMSNRP